jgi:hypothetical protein
MIIKHKKEMVLILCHMINKILKDVLEELFNAIKIKRLMKKLDKMHLIVLYKNKMLPKVGILNFIDYKIKFTLIGMVCKSKLQHSNRMIVIHSYNLRILDKRVNFGVKIGIFAKLLKQFF